MTDPAIGTLGSQTGLALERTRLAYERTMMAWVRTAISLITFGFTIYKFFQLEIAPPARAHVVIGPREFALVLIALALASLGTGAVQHRRALQTLRRLEPALASSSALGLAVVVWMLGVAALVAVWLRL
jgi:putative membrane protein